MTGLTSSALVFQKLWGSVLAILLAGEEEEGVRGITLPYGNTACMYCPIIVRPELVRSAVSVSYTNW